MYKLVAIAGTFDRLHSGHRFFISEAFKQGEKVLIGLTSDAFAKSKVKSQKSKVQLKIQNYEERKRQLEAFLKEDGYLERSTISGIDDVYGPAVENNTIEALVVTSDTYEGGRKVNEKRQSLGLTPLKLLQIPLVMAEDHKRIASTRIRLGEIDRWGRLYKLKMKNEKLKINEQVRQELKKPLGVLIKGDIKNHQEVVPELKEMIEKVQPFMLITVGDEVTKLCNESGINSDLSIIDFRVRRIKKYFSLSDLGFPAPFARGGLANVVRTVRNPAGSITISLVNSVSKAMKNLVSTGKQQIIKVEGEEDLAGVPAILLSPLGSLITYGQPGKGIVVVEVTEQKKHLVLNILNL